MTTRGSLAGSLGIAARARSSRNAFGALGALRQIDLAAKHRIVFNREPERANVAFYGATSAQLHPTGSNDVALDVAHDEHVFRGKVCGNIRARANSQSAFAQGHSSFYAPIYNQVFSALDFAADHDGFSYPSLTIFRCHYAIPFNVIKLGFGRRNDVSCSAFEQRSHPLMTGFPVRGGT